MHDELELAELAAARVRALDPLLQAGLVDPAQGAGAEARGDEGQVDVALAVADAADVLAAQRAAGHRRRLRGGTPRLHARGGGRGRRGTGARERVGGLKRITINNINNSILTVQKYHI